MKPLLTIPAILALAVSLTGCNDRGSIKQASNTMLVKKWQARYDTRMDDLRAERDLLRQLGDNPADLAKFKVKYKQVVADLQAERSKIADRIIASK